MHSRTPRLSNQKKKKKSRQTYVGVSGITNKPNFKQNIPLNKHPERGNIEFKKSRLFVAAEIWELGALSQMMDTTMGPTHILMIDFY